MTSQQKANQHFVPRFYLRNFSTNSKRKCVSLYNLQCGRYVASASIRREATGRYIYGQDNKVEDMLMLLESKICQVIAGILQSHELPHRDSEEYHGLLAHILIQRRRTPSAGKELLDFANKPLAAALQPDSRLDGIGTDWILSPDDPILASMAYSTWMWPLLLDLHAKLILSSRSAEFLTSDSPVVYYNQFLKSRRPGLGNIGMLTKGLQIVFPLSPTTLLMLYDHRVYRVGDKKDDVVWIQSPKEVDKLNSLQLVCADRNLYFSSGITESHVTRLAAKSKRARSKYRTEVIRYWNAPNTNEQLVHVRPPEARCNLDLAFSRVHRRMRKVDLGENVALPRDEEMQELLYDFSDLVSQKRADWADFFPFLVQKGKASPPKAMQDE